MRERRDGQAEPDHAREAQRASWLEARTFVQAGLALIGEDAVLRSDLRMLRSLLKKIDARIASIQ
jgi:hypothetical protein